MCLPDGSGLDVRREWRRAGRARPFLLLTARNMAEDRIEGLDLGADDYLGKPFDLGELAARLRALRRRDGGRADPMMRIGSLEIDPATRRVCLKGQAIDLSRREFAVLERSEEHTSELQSLMRISYAVFC